MTPCINVPGETAGEEETAALVWVLTLAALPGTLGAMVLTGEERWV
jgi:hypothetical protein